MIKLIEEGDIFQTVCPMIVMPVNCVGVCGKGLAKHFKEYYPEAFRFYKKACASGDLKPGRVLEHRDPKNIHGHGFFLFATKDHWRNPSEFEWIDAGLNQLEIILNDDIERPTAVAVPALGCGNGGMDWGTVWDLVEIHLGNIPGVNIELYGPQ